MVFMLYSGLSQALSIRVSNSLGAGAPKVARRATWTAECLNLILSTVVAVALWLGSHQWPRLFTNIPSVVAATATLMPIFALTLPGDGTNCTLQGLLRGAGAQKLGASGWRRAAAARPALGAPAAAFGPAKPGGAQLSR